MTKSVKHRELIPIWEKDASTVIDYYRKRIRTFGDITSKTFDWRSDKECYMFFEVATGLIPIDDVNSVLDVGCGSGNFYDFINDRFDKIVDYTGVDIVHEFINYGKKNERKLDIKVVNFISENFSPSRQYDLVINLGGLNSRVRHYNEYLEYNIYKMVKYSRKFVVFNVIISTEENFFPNKNDNKIGHITRIEEERLRDMLKRICLNPKHRYWIIRKSIFENSVDAFVIIKK